MKRKNSYLFAIGISLLFLCGCESKRSVTMDLEAIRMNPEASAVVQAIREYQVEGAEHYRYPALSSWLDVNRTVSIYGAEPGQITVFLEDEAGDLQWRDVDYAYPFYDAEYLTGKKADGESFLMVAPLQTSSDGQAVAYQVIEKDSQLLAVSERGKKTVLLNGDGAVWSEEGAANEEESAWNRFEYSWSSDGQILLYYKMGALAGSMDEEAWEEWQEEHPGEDWKESDVLLLPHGVYGYDRRTGQVRMIWKPMRLNMPVSASRYPSSASVVADAGESSAAMFLLFDDQSGCPDVLLWNQEGKIETALVELPENPCIQIVLKKGIYYYQENGEIRRASLGKTGQTQTLVSTSPGIQTFLVSEDENRVFTIENRENTADICLYLRDEKKNWYKQVIYVGAEGAISLQLSEEQQLLLVECRGEAYNQALILSFCEEE